MCTYLEMMTHWRGLLVIITAAAKQLGAPRYKGTRLPLEVGAGVGGVVAFVREGDMRIDD